jgi:hypothetical protein
MDDETLEEGAKILYARISMYSKDGKCWASNRHFAEKQKVTNRCIQNWLRQLIDAGYIEVDVRKGGFQTERDIWIVIDFKKMYTKRTTVHPIAKCSSPPEAPQFAQININKTNIKTKREAKPPRTLFGSHVLLYEKEYEELCEKYGKERLDRMIEKMNLGIASKGYEYKCFKSTIQSWFLNEKDDGVKNYKTDSSEKNIEFCKSIIQQYNSRTYYINLLSKEVEFTPRGNGQPICLRYSENGFKEQFENNLRKCGFEKVTKK